MAQADRIMEAEQDAEMKMKQERREQIQVYTTAECEVVSTKRYMAEGYSNTEEEKIENVCKDTSRTPNPKQTVVKGKEEQTSSTEVPNSSSENGSLDHHYRVQHEEASSSSSEHGDLDHYNSVRRQESTESGYASMPDRSNSNPRRKISYQSSFKRPKRLNLTPIPMPALDGEGGASSDDNDEATGGRGLIYSSPEINLSGAPSELIHGTEKAAVSPNNGSLVLPSLTPATPNNGEVIYPRQLSRSDSGNNNSQL